MVVEVLRMIGRDLYAFANDESVIAQRPLASALDKCFRRTLREYLAAFERNTGSHLYVPALADSSDRWRSAQYTLDASNRAMIG